MNNKQPKRHIVYISGPITGNPYYKKHFALAENLLRMRGFIVINPASLVLDWADAMPDAECWAGYVSFDLALLERMKDMVQIYFLPGSNRSKGSRMEYACAIQNEIPCRNIIDEYPNWFSKLEELNNGK